MDWRKVILLAHLVGIPLTIMSDRRPVIWFITALLTLLWIVVSELRRRIR